MNSISLSSHDSRHLLRRISASIEGEAYADRFTLGRYSSDASFYQIEPILVAIPKTEADLQAILEIAGEEGCPVLARGGATSQSGQTVGRALIIDFSKYLRNVVSVNANERRCVVQPGIVLDDLNRTLAPTGLWFPVDVSTSSRATIGGMAGNNSCGTRSLRYGIMRNNVQSIRALLADGTDVRFGEVPEAIDRVNMRSNAADLMQDLLQIGQRDAEHIRQAFPDVSRRVGGYTIDALVANGAPVNLAEILIGSEGTLAISKRIELKLAPRAKNRALGVCQFSKFRAAMESAIHIVKLGPVAVELVDRTIIDLGLEIPMFRATIEKIIKGQPDALLLVEFAEDDQSENLRRLKKLDELMGDLGHPDSVVEAIDESFQKEIWEVRKSGLNVVMSMKREGKPISFIEDCAVPLEHLADYTEQLTEVFERHGTVGTWYAHAAVGCLHVRPVLNLKLEADVRKMRSIAEEAFALVRNYKGAHSGEHGDGLVRSEFHEFAYGRRTVEIFEEVKDRFDPNALLNPGKIVRPERMDDRNLFRFRPGYHVGEFKTALDWSDYPGAGGGFQGAVEMCNNNGACRKFDASVMCPSFRVTRNERDVTRGRANTLRLAMSGQLGRDALVSPEMQETMKLCVSCKGCRRECPTGVDLAKMKIEVQHAMVLRHGLSLHDRLVAYLPRYAPFASKLSWLLNMRNVLPGLATLMEYATGFSRERPLPRWRFLPFAKSGSHGPAGAPEVALFADTFSRYFDPENLDCALRLLVRAGYRVHILQAPGGGRPLCCGRTFLTAGLVDQARQEAARMLDAVAPFIARDVPVIGLEPSCLFTFKDEFLSMLPGKKAEQLGQKAMLLEEFLIREKEQGRLKVAFHPRPVEMLLHGHCHQKAFGAMGAVEAAARLIPDINVTTISSSCCGMAGDFGYNAETYDVSMAMGELSLLPAVRAADDNALIVADGFSCRHQIRDGSGRRARHLVQVLDEALNERAGP
ncbi:putative FAD-linked oxidoreductase [bacterium MnTg02]|nr:putative FAD-linked oxidoreductase [bacterium MnTg02]